MKLMQHISHGLYKAQKRNTLSFFGLRSVTETKVCGSSMDSK
uniref:Uncharacterized protein n=1 Tax=Echinococcus granulosus TaxID=6210 RepID=A0A068WTT8_ECHGR|nr:hypothetical protein EgrG_000096800 [Echinococcus granulosus]